MNEREPGASQDAPVGTQAAADLPGPAGIDPACALCGGRERRILFREGPHSIVRCSACELVYVTPRREERALMAEVYGADYWRSPAARERGYSDYLGDEALYLRTFRARWRRLARHLPRGGRALDVGCAAGFSMVALAERGFEVHGIEPSPAIRAAAVARFGAARIHGGTLVDLPHGPGSFELISLWDVLEHLCDPLAALARTRELLAPEGRLVIETQDVNSWAARLLGRRWTHYKHAEHLLHFSPRTLTRALERTGFEVLFRTRRGAGKYVSPRFVAERARRVAPWLAWAADAAARLPVEALYVNPLDEMIVVARRAGPGRGSSP